MCDSVCDGHNLPTFDELRARGSRLEGTLWGLFDRGHVKDELGSKPNLSLS